MAIQPICSSTFGNLGATCDAGNGLGTPTGIILTTDSFEFASFADFSDEDKYVEAIRAKQMFPLMGIQEMEDQTEETTYYENQLGGKIKMREGKYGFKYNFYMTLEQHKELQKFSSAKLRYFVVDSKNQIRGYSPDGVSVKGFSISTFEAEKMKPATADTPAFSPVMIIESNPAQWNGFGVTITPSWEAESLSSLTNVTVSVVGTPISTKIVVSVGAYLGLNPDGSKAYVDITGIPLADFVKKTTAGDTQTISTVTDNGDGTYNLNGTGFTTGTVDLVSPAVMTGTGLLIESTGAATVTI